MRLIPLDRLDEEKQILGKISAGNQLLHFETVRRRKDDSLVDVSSSSASRAARQS